MHKFTLERFTFPSQLADKLQHRPKTMSTVIRLAPFIVVVLRDKFVLINTLLKSDVTRRDHVSVAMDAGSRIVNFIRDGTVFA